MGLRRIWFLAISAAAFSLFAPIVSAQTACHELVGHFVSVEGDVQVQRADGGAWRTASLEGNLCEGDTVRVGNRSRAAVRLINNAVLRIDQGTAVRLSNISDHNEESSWIDLDQGAIQSFSRRPLRLKVNTRNLQVFVHGTEFLLRAERDRSLLAVLEGRVVAQNPRGQLLVESGEAVIAKAGKAPERYTAVRPRNAVQWALYYPPLLAALDGRQDRVPADTPPGLRAALQEVGRGHPARALGTLDQVPHEDRDALFFVYRAALLLAVGRIGEAQSDIAEALRQRPDEGLGHALRAIIDVVQNRPQEALRTAERAVASSRTAAAKIALSYAQQANFQLDSALNTLLDAVREHPDNALAWARLGEIRLMLGDRPQALEAAQKAATLSPGSARAQLVLGFAALAEYRNLDAREAFERAIRLDSAAPLARLGLGLAKISAGGLAEGRQELEVAVGLDADNALLRAYLGKAYFEEKRAPLDAEQYRRAKELDPRDPTAYLYDGIRAQTENRPIEALRDLQTSVDLNDERAVYRSRLLLDKDRAARGTSLARTYRDLGFAWLGIYESADSLAGDPSNASAHRFLSDTYLGVRRREIARVSELLQAQLMQDININPIQPSIAETNLNIVTIGGSATPGFNEFTPLFERNMAQLNVTGFGGSHDTYGGEGVVTAVYDRFSFSAGGYHHFSDGWRNNNSLDQSIYNVYAQAALTPDWNLQAEFRHRESTEGDLAFNFDPENYLRDKQVTREQDTARVGLRYTPTPRSNLLFSFIHSDRDEQLTQTTPVDPFTSAAIQSNTRDGGDQFEGQYLYQRGRLNLIAGVAHSQVDQHATDRISFTDLESGMVFPFVAVTRDEIEQTRGYLYSHLVWPSPVTWTLGFSYDDYQEGLVRRSSFNPKFGAQWDVTETFRLRAAAFRVVKPALVNNRTIEPTQIAGFNQFFDDVNATRYSRYGGGFNWRPMRNLYLGGEMTWRTLDEPVSANTEEGIDIVVFENRNEVLHSFYAYWTPTDQWGIRAEFAYDRYRSEQGIATDSGDVPEEVETFSVPLTASYFHPSGFFASLGGTLVSQQVRRSDSAPQGAGHDTFFLVDAALGYRLPKRFGLLSFGVKNLFDTQFRYQDDSYREFRDESSTGPYFPDRMVLARFTLSF